MNCNRRQKRAPIGVLLSKRWPLWFVFSAALADCALAEEKPLFELGMGVGGLNQPYYPGTKEKRNVLFPAPLPIYRGRIIKSDSRGVRAEVVNEPRYRLEFSVDLNFAIDSEDIDARAGMADIDTMFQIGPSLEIDLFKGERNRIKLNLPVRMNFGLSRNGLADDGMTFAPNLSFHHGFIMGDKPWLASLAVGPQFGTEQFHDVYYTVANRYATEDRPAYYAEGGFSGTRVSASLRSRNHKRLWVWFVRYDNLSGAEFEDSPLVETKDNVTVGFIYSKFVYRSKTKVDYSSEE